MPPKSSTSTSKILLTNNNNDKNDQNQTSAAFTVQYNNINYRLDQIDTKIDKINLTFNNFLQLNNNNNSNFTSNQNNKKKFIDILIKNKTILFIFFLWSTGLVIALLTNRFKFF